jgi:hypothetical protein
MHDNVDPAQRVLHRAGITNVPLHELDVRVQVGRRGVAAMHLWRQVVEHAHLVSFGEKPTGEVRSDETGPAGDQHLFDQISLSFLAHDRFFFLIIRRYPVDDG